MTKWDSLVYIVFGCYFAMIAVYGWALRRLRRKMKVGNTGN